MPDATIYQPYSQPITNKLDLYYLYIYLKIYVYSQRKVELPTIMFHVLVLDSKNISFQVQKTQHTPSTTQPSPNLRRKARWYVSATSDEYLWDAPVQSLVASGFLGIEIGRCHCCNCNFSPSTRKRRRTLQFFPSSKREPPDDRSLDCTCKNSLWLSTKKH